MSHTFWMRVGGIDVQIIIILRHTKIALASIKLTWKLIGFNCIYLFYLQNTRIAWSKVQRWVGGVRISSISRIDFPLFSLLYQTCHTFLAHIKCVFDANNTAILQFVAFLRNTQLVYSQFKTFFHGSFQKPKLATKK